MDNRVTQRPDLVGLAQPPASGGNGSSPKNGGAAFEQVLQDQIAGGYGLKFSAHARQRLQTRSIQLDKGDVERIGHAVDQADQKGSKESLILVDDLAFLVSVKNRTVITAVDNSGAKGNVFTNIDSVVIA